jgi:hypothetical protein
MKHVTKATQLSLAEFDMVLIAIKHKKLRTCCLNMLFP